MRNIKKILNISLYILFFSYSTIILILNQSNIKLLILRIIFFAATLILAYSEEVLSENSNKSLFEKMFSFAWKFFIIGAIYLSLEIIFI